MSNIQSIIHTCLSSIPFIDAKNIAGLISSFSPTSQNYLWSFKYRAGSITGGCFTADCIFIASSIEECREIFKIRDYESYYHYISPEIFETWCQKVSEKEIVGPVDIIKFDITEY